MTAIDELTRSIDLERLVKDITSKLNTDMAQIIDKKTINDLRYHTFPLLGSDAIIGLMLRIGLLGRESNHFGIGVYWYTPPAKELYEALKKEGFYDKK